MIPNHEAMKNSNLLINILIAGLIAGTLDILAAIFILAGGDAVRVFKGIASGALGKTALTGGIGMIALGALFHYIIAMSWTAAYFLLYPKLSFLERNKWLNAAAYGAIVWSIMNLVVLPLTKIGLRPMTLSGVLKNMLILIVCIGLPVSLIANRFYRTATPEQAKTK